MFAYMAGTNMGRDHYGATKSSSLQCTGLQGAQLQLVNLKAVLRFSNPI